MGFFLLSGGTLTPHGFCLAWSAPLMMLHVVSDAVIALSYYSIPLALAYFVHRRTDVAFSWILLLSAAFILACGTTHAVNIWTLWFPSYVFDGLLKALTAAISVVTAVMLWWIMPKALALPSTSQLNEVNEELRRQIAERDAAVEALRREQTERMQTEEMLRQAQKMEAVGQLTGGIAHDFNNLLMIVIGNLEMLGGKIPLGDPARRHVDRAMTGAQRGAALTQSLLSFARRQSLQPRALDANELIASMSGILRATLGGSLQFDVRSAPGLWTTEVDPNQLENALINLVVNARDAMPEGGHLTIETANVTLDRQEARARAIDDLGDYASISVTDTGLGMTEAVRRAAFEPFFTTKDVGKGSGLGLSQVYGFVLQSRGHVTLRSAPGEGTTVTLLLPRYAPVEARAAAAVNTGIGLIGSGGLLPGANLA